MEPRTIGSISKKEMACLLWHGPGQLFFFFTFEAILHLVTDPYPGIEALELAQSRSFFFVWIIHHRIALRIVLRVHGMEFVQA